MQRRFRNRLEAGELLGATLQQYALEQPVWVMGIPRGGVVVAYGVAKALKAPLDAIVARKIGAPNNPELGIGAISQGGVTLWNESLVNALNLSPTELERLRQKEALELTRREHVYRGNRPLPNLQGVTVVVVDDGLATGITAQAAVESVRRMGAKHTILAVPVCAPGSFEMMEGYVDRLLCLEQPDKFHAVGLWYVDFPQVSDEEVLAYIDAANRWIK